MYNPISASPAPFSDTLQIPLSSALARPLLREWPAFSDRVVIQLRGRGDAGGCLTWLRGLPGCHTRGLPE